MSIKTKIAIFALAALLTFAGFNLLVPSSAVDLAKLGKKAGYKIISNVLEKAEATAPHSRVIRG